MDIEWEVLRKSCQFGWQWTHREASMGPSAWLKHTGDNRVTWNTWWLSYVTIKTHEPTKNTVGSIGDKEHTQWQTEHKTDTKETQRWHYVRTGTHTMSILDDTGETGRTRSEYFILVFTSSEKQSAGIFLNVSTNYWTALRSLEQLWKGKVVQHSHWAIVATSFCAIPIQKLSLW